MTKEYKSTVSKDDFSLVADDKVYLDILESCRPFYYPEASNDFCYRDIPPRFEDSLKNNPRQTFEDKIARVTPPPPETPYRSKSKS
mmetsp:Transcript_25963/g.39302  ORF Transcript_25963/g.39302 Transcript_25963/m.39302 type:complete len:86 (+) Transcript_25963:250-507(+)